MCTEKMISQNNDSLIIFFILPKPFCLVEMHFFWFLLGIEILSCTLIIFFLDVFFIKLQASHIYFQFKTNS